MAAHPGSLPKPSLTFSVPSVHDGLALDCRVYHPPSLAVSPRPDTPPWQKHAAVVAHPYAPLGGCYDDPIVDIVSATLLRLGFLVVTFNFRFAFTIHCHKLIWPDLILCHVLEAPTARLAGPHGRPRPSAPTTCPL